MNNELEKSQRLFKLVGRFRQLLLKGHRMSEMDSNDPTREGTPEAGTSDILSRTTLPAHLLPSASTSSSSTTPGLIYLSRIPPGMGPSKVRDLLSAYGAVGRVYLSRDGKDKERASSRKHEKHQSHNFKEGWVEFMDKRVARSVASLLNANPIGGKKGSRWRDDVWTMKYLPRFRWDMLSEQVALERATQTSLLRHHLSTSRKEQESYLSAVERARTSEKIKEKAISRGKEASAVKVGRAYKQREAVNPAIKNDEGRGGTREDLTNVLSNLF